MAKKKKENENGEKKKKGGIILTITVVLLILILWIAVFAILIKLDVGGLGTLLRPSLKDVPLLNTLLPVVPPEQEQWEEDYPYTTVKEAIDRIKELEGQLDSASTDSSDLRTQITDLQAEIERLKVFEDDVKNFEERVKRFDNMVVFNPQAPSLEEYKKFYEEINPTTAEEIYQLVLEKLQYDQGIKAQADILKTMKPGQAAAVLEQSTADIGLISEWLLAMKTKESAAIIDKMTPLYAAKIFRKMADMNEEALNDIVNQMDYQ